MKTTAHSGRAIPALLAALLLAGCYGPESTTAGPLWRVEPVLRVGGEAPRGQLGESYYRLGRYYDGQQRMREAESAYRRALAADPLHAEAHNALGVLLAGQGALDQAIASLEQAVAIAPERSHILSNLGYAHLLAGRKSEAERHLSQALRLDPANPRALANLNSVRRALALSAPAQSVSPRPELVPVPAEMARPPAMPGTAMADSAPLESAAAPTRAGAAPSSVASDVPMSERTLEALPLALSPVLAEARLSSEPVLKQAAFAAQTQPSVQAQLPVQIQAASAAQAKAQSPASTPPGLQNQVQVSSQPDGAKLRRLRFEIANGMGERGAARKLNRLLMQDGLPSAYLTDDPPFTQQQTAVRYASARYAQAAQNLARRLGAQAQEEKRLWLEHAVGLRIVLGKDIQAVLAALPDEAGELRIASAGQ